MKTPRVNDFDPNAKPPELGSPMDNMPIIQKSSEKPLQSQTISKDKKIDQSHPYPVRPVRDVPPVPLVRPVLPVPPVKRVMKPRHPFDIYQDQYDSLKQMAAEERTQGGVGSMSAMVREAIDRFIMA